MKDCSLKYKLTTNKDKALNQIYQITGNNA